MGPNDESQKRLGANSTPTTSKGPGSTGDWGRWTTVVIFSVAMAWVEAAVVLYLRTLVNRLEPYQPEPLPEFGGLERAEIIREFATLAMLGALGWLAGTSWRNRLAYALVGFGVWDIFYYLFLKYLTGWPHSLFDWDVLFLLPLPWWGPVAAPAAVALLMICFGTMISQRDRCAPPLWPRRWAIQVCLLGSTLALYVFMADALSVVQGGVQAVRNVLPQSFNWPWFLLALALMAAPVFDLARRSWTSRSRLRGTLANHIGQKA